MALLLSRSDCIISLRRFRAAAGSVATSEVILSLSLSLPWSCSDRTTNSVVVVVVVVVVLVNAARWSTLTSFSFLSAFGTTPSKDPTTEESGTEKRMIRFDDGGQRPSWLCLWLCCLMCAGVLDESARFCVAETGASHVSLPPGTLV